MRKAGAIAILCLLLAGCGSERSKVPDLGQTAAPAGFKPFVLPGADVAFTRPINWTLIGRQPPGIATMASGGASLTVWAYRSVAGVTDPSSAKLAQKRLLASLKRRDPTFKVSSSKVTRVAGAPAVEIRGSGQIAGRPMETVSVHVYKGRGEYVIDAFADPSVFERADREVFEKVLANLTVGGQPPTVAQGVGPGTPAAPAAPATPGG